MINKKLALLLIAFTVASCSSNKKNIQTDSSFKPQESPKVVTKDQKSAIEDTTMFSVSPEEIKASGTKPQVVYFDTNSAKLTDKAIATLAEKVLAEAKDSKTKRVVIEAHCDERGSVGYNKKLSDRRAKSVKKYLVENGVKAVKIKTVGYGKSKPVALGHDEEAWAQNRRAVTISLKK